MIFDNSVWFPLSLIIFFIASILLFFMWRRNAVAMQLLKNDCHHAREEVHKLYAERMTKIGVQLGQDMTGVNDPEKLTSILVNRAEIMTGLLLKMAEQMVRIGTQLGQNMAGEIDPEKIAVLLAERADRVGERLRSTHQELAEGRDRLLIVEGSLASSVGAVGEACSMDDALGKYLQLISQDTEKSATDIIQRVSVLATSAKKLVEYLAQSDLDGARIQTEIEDSTKIIRDISEFICKLPEQIRQDRANIMELMEALKGLGKKIEDIQSISQTTNMLSLNASIEAARAGEAGKSFNVVAQEVRNLAGRSSRVAQDIEQEVTRVISLVDERFGKKMAESLARNENEAHSHTHSAEKLQDNYEDLKRFYSTLLSVIRVHNEALANDIMETLGSIQFQDIVRQKIERMENALKTRQSEMEVVRNGLERSEDVSASAEAMRKVVETYLNGEVSHAHYDLDGGSLERPKLELF